MTPCVRLLGKPRVETGDDRGPRGKKSWAVLARIALSERPVGRAELAGELFADADDPMGALRWCLADLRRCLEVPGLVGGDPLVLAPDAIWLDVWALRDGTLPVRDIGGVLLDGAEPRHCARFDTWLLLARGECAARSREELRLATLRLLATGEAEASLVPAGRAAALDPLDEDAQELFLRALVAAGHAARASVHLALCEAVFTREGLSLSPAVRAAARAPGSRPRMGVRAKVVAASLRSAGTAALDAGSVDAGIETLRRAVEEAELSGDAALHADILRTLGSALVHAVRGFDGEGAVVLHQAMRTAGDVASPALTADILRELAFVDLQAGRHASAERALAEAARHAELAADPALTAGILGIQGMNQADRGRHGTGAALLSTSVDTATAVGQPRQVAWSQGVLARSLLLSGHLAEARAAAERSIELCDRERWNAFRPLPLALRAHVLVETGHVEEARDDAEEAFALACELGDPCWEGLAGRALALAALRTGDPAGAEAWIVDARQRCDRVPDRYVWVSAYVGLAHLEIAASHRPDVVGALAARLRGEALRTDLPEFVAWALVYQAEAGDPGGVDMARSLARDVANPALRARADALTRPLTRHHG